MEQAVLLPAVCCRNGSNGEGALLFYALFAQLCGKNVSLSVKLKVRKCMRRFYCLWLLAFLLMEGLSAGERVVRLKIVETTDVHGNYYPYDFIGQRDAAGSLARVYDFVQKERRTYGDNLILLDNGDFLQGQPSAYYYNYMDTVAPHLGAEMLNFMGYDAATVGNHDIETGRAVFDRWAADCNFPVLGANVIETATGNTHFKPYVVLEREGVRIAVLGMITPAIPMWLPENLWQGLRFDDMEETARKWMKVIREQERADVVIGLFHAGKEAYLMGEKYRENASVDVARRVPGFDVVLMGHDHARACMKVANVEGDSVLVVNPASNAVAVGDVDIALTLRDGKVADRQVTGRLTEVRNTEVSREFTGRFAPQYEKIQAFVSKKIGHFTKTISTRPAYFGSSAFVDLIHRLQLEIGGAEISLAAPLSFDTEIKEGDVFVSDMFSLYKYENMLYTMMLSGKEVHDALEMSYSLWTNRMTSADDHLLLLREQRREGAEDRASFKHPSYNFDSAAGIVYTVDVTKPAGEKVHIVSMADGTPFCMDRMYKVAVNSYRGNGGGELLTEGAGIPQEKLKERIIYSTDKDLRYYLMQYIERKGDIDPCELGQWRFVPEEWTQAAARRDYEYLFGTVR